MKNRIAKKVLLIGWDAADWKVINPLLDNGMMPALESIVNNGVIGNIATLDPSLSPMLWTSISTGKHADEHGILGFTEPSPDGKSVRPVMITSRKVKAIWNMLTQSGFKTNVVGWWPSHPAEPINGISISNFYQRATVEYGEEWAMTPGTVHPKEKEEIFKELRIHPEELTEAHILPFVPGAAKIDQEKDKRLSTLGKIITDCSTINAAATYILENEEWDFTAVYFDAVDHFCHAFMKYHPPKMENIPEEIFELYKGVVEGGYIYHDMMLRNLLQLAGEDTTVLLISDHGFHSDHLRPKGLPDEPAAPVWEHREYGIFCMKGPGIKKDERIYGATLLDVTPTILTLFGLPLAHDMPGKPLVTAFEEPPQLQYVDSWEEIDGHCGMHPKEIQRDPIAEQAAMQQLIELGYIEKPGEDIEKRIDKTVNESKFYLARVYMNKNKFSESLPILEDLHQKQPDIIRYAYTLAKCLDSLGRIDEALVIVKKIIQNEKQEYPQLFLLQGSLEFARKNYEKALEYLDKALKADPKLPQLYQQLGFVYLKMRRRSEAEAAFYKALENDHENPKAYYGLALINLRKKEYEKSIDYALNAVGLLYHYPHAHQVLGIAFAKVGMYERAAQALEVAVKIRPGFLIAHKYLSYIYSFKLKNLKKADYHIDEIKRLRTMMEEQTK